MKNKIVAVLIFCGFLIKTYGQDTIPFINFIDPKPEWKVATYDPTFVKDPLGYFENGYEGKFSVGIKPYRDKILIMENTLGQALYQSNIGLLLTMVHQSDGKIEWIHAWTENTGLTHREMYGLFNFEMNDMDDSITLGSCRDTASLNINSSVGRTFLCKPSIRTINLLTGDFISQFNNEESDYLAFSEDGSRVVINSKKEPYFVTHKVSTFDTAFVNNVYIQPLNDTAGYDLDLTYVISDTSTIPYQIPTRNFTPIISDIDKNTLVVFMGDNHINDKVNSPKRLTMYIVDISDKSNIKIITKRNIEELLTFPQSDGRMSFSRTNNAFIFGYTLRDDDNKIFYYFNLFDNKGNHIKKVDPFEMGNRRYFNTYSVGDYNDEYYFTSIYYKTSLKFGVDLFKINLKSGVLSLVKELQFEEDSKKQVRCLFNNYMDKQGNIYIGFQLTYQNPPDLRNYNQYYKFSAKSLGIETNVIELKNVSINLYPNPTEQILNINFDNMISQGKIIIENINGQIVYEDFISFEDAKQISVLNLTKGLYIVKVHIGGQQKYISKFVKV